MEGHAIPELVDKTRSDYARLWEKHIRRDLGGYSPRAVTSSVTDEYRAGLVAADAGEATVGKALTILSGMFRCAVKWGRVDLNSMREIRIPQPKRTSFARHLPPRTVEAIRQAVLAVSANATLVSTLAYAGLRLQEVRGLQLGRRWAADAAG